MLEQLKLLVSQLQLQLTKRRKLPNLDLFAAANNWR